MTPQRISIELTNRCSKGCAFCYNRSNAAGDTRWTVQELVSFVQDCADHGVQAVSFGGGEPLEYAGVFEVLRALDGRLFRPLTTNGLPLRDDAVFDELVAARPQKVHVSIHFPDRGAEVDRVIAQVQRLATSGIRSGVNLVVARSSVDASAGAAERLRRAGVGNDRIVYLPMRGSDTPTPRDVARVAGDTRFQSMTCLAGCGKSERFCSVSWDQKVAWCSYTSARRELPSLDHAGLVTALDGLGLVFCGGTSG